MSHEPLAEITGKENRRKVTLHRTFRASPQELWTALTEPEQISQWFAPCKILEPRVGGRIQKDHTDGSGFMMEGVVRAFDPPKLFEYDWVSEELTSVVRYELEPEGAGTRLTLTEFVLTDAMVIRRGGGWSLHLERLGKHLAGAPSPASAARWHALCAEVEKLLSA